MTTWKEKFIPYNEFSRPQLKLLGVKKLVVHWTANPGGTAENHYNYFKNLNDRFASAHIFVDRTQAICIIPLNEVAYHANDGGYSKISELRATASYYKSGNANLTSVGVELCVEKDGTIHADTIARAADIFADLCKQFKLDPIKDIVRHYDITGKSCPTPWVKDNSKFVDFKNKVKEKLSPKQQKSVYYHATLNGKAIKAVDIGGYVGLHWQSLGMVGVKDYSYKFSSDSKSVTFTINGKVTNNTRVYEGHSYIKYSEIHPDIDVKKDEKGVYNFFIKEQPKPQQEEKKQVEEICTDVTHSPIMGNPTLTKNQMLQFQHKHAPNAPEGIIDLYYDLGLEEGVKGEVAFAQSIIETGYFEYKGSSVTPDMNNFCGMGATGNGVKGNSFPDIKTGVLAQIQHLKGYASTEELKNECVDPRFKYVKRGIAPHVEDLSNRWAMNANYGKDILKIVDKIAQMPDEPIIANAEIIISVDKEAIVEGDKVYIPVRSIASAIGQNEKVGWNNDKRKVLLDKVELVTTKLIGETGYAEIGEVGKLLNIKFTYDKENKIVKIG